jgi:ammonium transporter, Amt family
MKQLFALIASLGILIGALGVSTVTSAQDKDKAAAPTTTAPAPAPAAAPAPAPAAAAPAADSKAEPPKADAAAAPAAAPPAPTSPQIIGVDKINSGDTAWMLASTALVLLMTIPGLALFYGGMVRKKNVLATLMQSFAITCLVTVLWVIAGYSLAFMPGGSFMGSLDRLFLNGMLFQKDAGKISVSHLGLTIPESVYMTFQMTFAIITPALIAGAFADRMKFSAMLWFIGLWSLLIYSPIAHMMWEPSGYWAAKGVLDFAGGTVVHINAGTAGLVCALVLGKRIGYGKEAMAPHKL